MVLVLVFHERLCVCFKSDTTLPINMWHFEELLNVLAHLFSVKYNDPGAGEMAQKVRCWPYKHENLSVDSQHPHDSRAWQCRSVILVLER